tara:strand:- start:965 stop:1864 length:900 start_codon:yes stop_codon:yes gene_type:complete
MNILVTGGAGFLGSHLVDELVLQSYNVLVFDDLSRGEKSQVNPKADFVEGDVRDSEKWEKLCNAFNPDVIHHLAAVNGTKRFHKEADLVVDVNVNGTRNAIEFAQKYNARLVFYSSPESFGEQEKMPLSNHSESVFPPAHLHQRHSYGASKHVGELLCHFAHRNGLDVRIVRPCNVYGPRLHGNENGQVVSIMLQSNPIIVHGDGLQTRSFTWVHDIVEALVKVGQIEGLSGHSFNLGSTEEVTILQLAQMISRLRLVNVEYGEPNFGDSARRIPDVSGNHLIDWVATTKLEDGLNQLL